MRRPLRLLGACLFASGVLWALGLAYGQDAIPFAAPPGQQALASAGGGDDPFADAVLNYDVSTFLTNGSTKDGSNNVTKLTNLGTGGSTYDLTGVAGTPLWTDDGMGTGLDGIDFEAGDTDALFVNATPVTAAPFHVFVVGRVESGAASGRAAFTIGDKDVDDNECWNLMVTNTPALLWRGREDGASGSATHGATLSTGTTYLFEGRETSGTSRGANVDNGTEATNTTDKTPDGADRVAVGSAHDASPTAGQYYDGMIGHVLLYDSIQTGATRDAIIAALDAQWSIPGVTSTPPLGPSDPYRWPLLLAAAGLGLLLASLRRRPQEREGRLLRLQPEAARRAA